MTKLIYFDICAAFIMLPVIPAMIRKHLNHGTINRWFLVFCGNVLFTTLADIWAVSLDLIGPGNVAAKYIAHTAYLVGRSLITPTCIAYLLARIGLWFKYKNYKGAVCAYYSLSIIPLILLLLVNPFKHVMFYLDETDAYKRGPAMLVMYAISLLYAFIGYYALIKYRKLYGQRKMYYLFVVFTMILLATAFQFVFPYILIENFSMSIASLIIALGIQAPEERLYGHTSFFRTSAFSDDMKMACEMGYDVGLILLSVTNYDTLRNMIGFDAMVECLDNISAGTSFIRSKTKADVEFYYLSAGQFVITLKNDNDGEIYELAKYINGIMNEEFNINPISVKFNTNLCVAKYPEDIDDVSDIIPVIENLKKMEYTGEIRMAGTEFDKKHYEIRRKINEVINRAIAEETLNLVYQPIYSVEKERYIAVEAFLRLNDSVFGNIEPEFLIKEAERCGAIHGITTYLLEKICEFVSGPEFMQLNLSWIELNLSPGQCMWTDLVSVVTSILDAYNVNPSTICFNIVDNDSEKYSGNMYENLEALAEMGIHIYMDDFGAGVFEVERIYGLPLEGVKLDREFIKMSFNMDSMLVLVNSVRMIKDMGLEIVAVGVEDLSARRRLVEMGCDMQQGYYYTAPKDKNELIRFMVGLPGVVLK